MRSVILGPILGLVLGGAVWAQEAILPNPNIEATIQSQIDAFLQDDFATAFGFASPNIQRMFRSPENFGMMVQRGYPMVWRPSDVQFGDLRDVAGALWQRVIVTDAKGAQHVLDYQMVQMDGIWRISGVQLVPQPGLSA